MIYHHSSLDTIIGYIYRNLPAERKLFVPNPKNDKQYARYTRICNLAYVIVHDYRHYDVYDNHPVDGLIVNIASVEPSTSDGSVDTLLDNLIKDIDNRILVAEVNENDTYSKNLFTKHGFELDREIDDTIYLVHNPSESYLG